MEKAVLTNVPSESNDQRANSQRTGQEEEHDHGMSNDASWEAVLRARTPAFNLKTQQLGQVHRKRRDQEHADEKACAGETTWSGRDGAGGRYRTQHSKEAAPRNEPPNATADL